MTNRKPKLGQNFLVDDEARHRIADALGDVRAATVVEIGPGHGAITSILAERAKRLICVELDASLAAELRFRFRNHANVEIVQADILRTDIAALLGTDERASVVGNLPYYITTDILLHLFAAAERLDRAIVMMQREVAERVSAEPGNREYGLLSCTAQMHASVSALFTLPPEAFQPPPEVYSTVLRMRFASRFAELSIADRAGFASFLRAVFQQKRKTLSNNLRAAGWTATEVAAACESAGTTPGVRAEALPLESLAAIFNGHAQHSAAT